MSFYSPFKLLTYSTINRACSLVSRTAYIGTKIIYFGSKLLYEGIKLYGNKSISFAKNIWFLLLLSSIFGWEYTCYLFGRKRIDCLKNVSNKMYNINKFSIKLFQVLSSTVDIFTEDEISYLKVYTDNSPYTSNDIDKSFLKTLEEVGKNNSDYMITLDSDINTPSHSGTVSYTHLTLPTKA